MHHSPASMLDFETIFNQLLGLDLTPLVLAILLGGAIGLEREIHGRPAGLRTHILVCLCSTVLIQASQQFQPDMPSGGTYVFDPQRLAAGIVTGIGFLGAAAVVRAGDIVRGITTGACVWSVAAIGVVIGQGAYGLAVATTIAFLAALIFLDWLTDAIPSVIYRRLVVTGQTNDLNKLTRSLQSSLKSLKIGVKEVTGKLEDGSFEMAFHLRCRQSTDPATVITSITTHEEVAGVNWTTIHG